MKRLSMMITAILTCTMAIAGTYAQNPSIAANQRNNRLSEQGSQSNVSDRRENNTGSDPGRNNVYDNYSWITLSPKPERTYKIGDLVTIIVREHREFEVDADLRTRKRLNLQSDLKAFIKLTDGGVGASEFSRGRPVIDYLYNNQHETRADTEREDRLTTRVTAKIIDVKPNGLLVIEAKAWIEHDDEVSSIALTGTCRKEDVTADNTVLSTQIADKTLAIRNEGAVRANTSRGWLLKLLDAVRPF